MLSLFIKIYRALLLFTLFISSAAKTQPREQVLHNLNSLLINAVMDDLFNPPVSSRIYTYPNIAFYECIRGENKNYPSLSGKLTGLYKLPIATNPDKTDRLVAAALSFSYVGQSLIGSEHKFEDWRKAFLDSVKQKTDPVLFNNSVQFGKAIADSIIAWIKKDNYGATRAMMRYVISEKEGRWQTTPVDFAAALEPNWGYMRPLTLKKASQFSPSKKLVYSMDKKSVFYKNVTEVYNTVKNLDTTKKAIAWYWDDNPNISVEQGHFNYFIHKISPAGHWLMITRQACLEKNIDVLKASQAYTLTSIALYDAFICCWYEKFTTDLVRPITVIKRYIDEKWEPLIQTPPFPEFTSGHAVISNAAATVLTHLLGENYSFTDNTEIPFGIKPRTFPSFLKAAEESSWSRVYAGIHYPETARISIQQGKLIGQHVLNTVIALPRTKNSK
jgi:hypothetical protein